MREALESILAQSYTNIEALVIRDGGCEVGDLEGEYADSRLTFIDRAENKGLPYSFNQLLRRCRGKYICYLGDDDILYPNHVATLIDALEGQDEYAVAYTDLYKAHCRVLPDGRRMILAKNVEVSRDFDRTTLMQFNHVQHVAMMHRRDLLEKTGLYNENLNVLVDFDLTRRMSFFTDFKHIREVTGEFYAPVGDCDRISVQKRKNVESYILNLLTIRTSRPAKPWPKIEDMSLILVGDRLGFEIEQALREIWSHTFWPYEIYLPLCEYDLGRLQTAVPNILGVAVRAEAGVEERVDEALKLCKGEYVSIVPANYRIDFEEVAWIEKSINAFMEGAKETEALELPKSTPLSWGVVLRREQLERARRGWGHLPIRESLIASGMNVRKSALDEWPFQFENLFTMARQLERQGDWLGAAEMYRLTAVDYQNELWMQTREANAFYHGGHWDEGLGVIKNVNCVRQTVSTLFLEARNYFMKEDYLSARNLLLKAEGILGFDGLEGAENVLVKAEEKLIGDDFGVRRAVDSNVGCDEQLEKAGSLDEEDMDTITETQIPDNGWTQHYDVVKELGDCHAMVGDFRQAQECYDRAAVLAPDEAGPYVGSGVIALQKGCLEDAEAAFRVATRLDPECSKAYCGLAMISQQREEVPAAFDYYLKSLELDNNNLTSLLGLFQLACRTGSFSKVIHYLEVYLDMHPGDIPVMFCLATLKLKDGNALEARELLSGILTLESDHSDASNLLEEVEHALAQNTNQETRL